MRYVLNAKLLLACGVPGLLLVIAAMLLPWWNQALGDPLGYGEGWVRIGLLLLGGWLIFAGWPRYIPRERTVAQQDDFLRRMEQYKEDLHRKVHR